VSIKACTGTPRQPKRKKKKRNPGKPAAERRKSFLLDLIFSLFFRSARYTFIYRALADAMEHALEHLDHPLTDPDHGVQYQVGVEKIIIKNLLFFLFCPIPSRPESDFIDAFVLTVVHLVRCLFV
jgi:hypothetical protein